MARQRKPSRQTRQVLQALFDTPAIWRYGYDLCKKTGMKSGTLYPILKRLSEQGFLVAEWKSTDEPGKPPRHVYRLSPDGEKLAQSVATTEFSKMTPAQKGKVAI